MMTNIISENLRSNKKVIRQKPLILEDSRKKFNYSKFSLYRPTCFILTYLKFAYIVGVSPFNVVTLNCIYEARKNRKTKVCESNLVMYLLNRNFKGFFYLALICVTDHLLRTLLFSFVCIFHCSSYRD